MTPEGPPSEGGRRWAPSGVGETSRIPGLESGCSPCSPPTPVSPFSLPRAPPPTPGPLGSWCQAPPAQRSGGDLVRLGGSSRPDLHEEGEGLELSFQPRIPETGPPHQPSACSQRDQLPTGGAASLQHAPHLLQGYWGCQGMAPLSPGFLICKAESPMLGRLSDYTRSMEHTVGPQHVLNPHRAAVPPTPTWAPWRAVPTCPVVFPEGAGPGLPWTPWTGNILFSPRWGEEEEREGHGSSALHS